MNYNSGVKYNLKVLQGGGMYNSAPYAVIVFDSGTGNDIISSVLSNIYASDAGTGAETIVAAVTLSQIIDTGRGVENISLTASASVSDSGLGIDRISSLVCQLSVVDAGTGVETIAIAETYFIIDSNRYLQPLNVLVLQDSRYELFPSLKEYFDSVPGRHGGLDFGNSLSGRTLELHVATDDGLTAEQKETLKRSIANHLNSISGAKTLLFADNIEKQYSVKYAGKITPAQYPGWFEFVIPFKMASPYITDSFENTLVGTGALFNSGTFETPLTIKMAGALTNPSIIIGAYTLTYTGTISAGQTLVIDTENMTVELDGVNVIQNYTGEMPLMLNPGNTSVTANNQVMFRWKDRWI